MMNHDTEERLDSRRTRLRSKTFMRLTFNVLGYIVDLHSVRSNLSEEPCNMNWYFKDGVYF